MSIEYLAGWNVGSSCLGLNEPSLKCTNKCLTFGKGYGNVVPFHSPQGYQSRKVPQNPGSKTFKLASYDHIIFHSTYSRFIVMSGLLMYNDLNDCSFSDKLSCQVINCDSHNDRGCQGLCCHLKANHLFTSIFGPSP